LVIVLFPFQKIYGNKIKLKSTKVRNLEFAWNGSSQK